MDTWMIGQMSRWRERFKPEAEIQARRLRCKHTGSDSSLQAQIQAWRLRSKPTGSDWSLEALISLRKPTWPRCARSIGDLICFQRMYRVCSSLLAQIQAWRLRFKPRGWAASLQAQIQAWRLRFKPGGWSTSMAWAPPKIPSQDFQNIGFIGFICFIGFLKVLLVFSRNYKFCLVKYTFYNKM